MDDIFETHAWVEKMQHLELSLQLTFPGKSNNALAQQSPLPGPWPQNKKLTFEMKHGFGFLLPPGSVAIRFWASSLLWLAWGKPWLWLLLLPTQWRTVRPQGGSWSLQVGWAGWPVVLPILLDWGREAGLGRHRGPMTCRETNTTSGVHLAWTFFSVHQVILMNL